MRKGLGLVLPRNLRDVVTCVISERVKAGRECDRFGFTDFLVQLHHFESLDFALVFLGTWEKEEGFEHFEIVERDTSEGYIATFSY